MFKKYKNLIIKLLIFIIVLISLIMIYCFGSNKISCKLIDNFNNNCNTLKPLRNYLNKKFNLSSKKKFIINYSNVLIIFIGLLIA